MTNFFLMTLVLTNWYDIPGDFKRQNGTNYVRQQLVLETNIYAVEVVQCTNRILLKSSSSGTNGPIQWRLHSALPPLPGPYIRSRE